MSSYLSKYCADFIRASYNHVYGGKLKASHARELVAAFFGYKSHAALIAEKTYPLTRLAEARILVPDIPLLEKRRLCLKGLPEDLPTSQELASELSSFLQDQSYFGGDVWLYESLETYVMEKLLIENDHIVMDELSGVMAETNAFFDEAYYETASISDDGDNLVITVDGAYSGTSHDDKPFCGDQIDMRVTVTLYRIAGRRGFQDFDISAGGAVNDDWVDPELKYGTIPAQRPKDQFIEMTGGFRIGESPDQFQQRQKKIQAIREKISVGTATVQDIDVMSKLLGTEEDMF